jgi:hypothetical protein
VPYQPALVGADLYLQWILQDPQASTLPFAFSDGAWVTLGKL